MAVLSNIAVSSGKTSPTNIVSSPVGVSKSTDGSSMVCKVDNNSSIQSPSAVSQTSQDETNVEREDECENENTWKGDSWSQEDVRNDRC